MFDQENPVEVVSEMDRLQMLVASLTQERHTLLQNVFQTEQVHAQTLLENSRLKQELNKHDLLQAKERCDTLAASLQARYRLTDLSSEVDWASGRIKRATEPPPPTSSPDAPGPGAQERVRGEGC